ncbi:hypothetical protein J2S46_005480 [Kitasatospora herbaricolor]|nr:hypothetical protein [Kitasatospora herbaricolor]
MRVEPTLRPTGAQRSPRLPRPASRRRRSS